MAERSGIHITGVDSGWPVASSSEAQPHKDGTGADSHPHADSVAGGVVTTSTSANEVQTVTVDATSGTFKLTYNGRQTGAIAEGATAAAVEAAIIAGTELTDADIAVTGPAGGPFTITFSGPEVAHKNVTAF